MSRIYCFGDSITRGENDHVGGGWADRLKAYCIGRHLKGAEEVSVFNLGIGGETTVGLSKRFLGEFKTRRSDEGKELVLFAYGANDAAELVQKLVVPQDAFLRRLKSCTLAATGRGCGVTFLTITPVAKASDGIMNRRGKIRSNARIAQYNAGLRSLAQELGAGLIDVNAAFLKRDLETLFVPDGVHPNAAGHEVIFQTVRDALNLARAK